MKKNKLKTWVEQPRAYFFKGDRMLVVEDFNSSLTIVYAEGSSLSLHVNPHMQFSSRKEATDSLLASGYQRYE